MPHSGNSCQANLLNWFWKSVSVIIFPKALSEYSIWRVTAIQQNHPYVISIFVCILRPNFAAGLHFCRVWFFRSSSQLAYFQQHNHL